MDRESWRGEGQQGEGEGEGESDSDRHAREERGDRHAREEDATHSPRKLTSRIRVNPSQCESMRVNPSQSESIRVRRVTSLRRTGFPMYLRCSAPKTRSHARACARACTHTHLERPDRLRRARMPGPGMVCQDLHVCVFVRASERASMRASERACVRACERASERAKSHAHARAAPRG